MTGDKFTPVKISARFFAQLRDVTQNEIIDLDLPDDATVADLLEHIYSKFPILREHDKTILVGAGVEFVDRAYKLKSGEEVAIMPPVQGG